MTSASVGVKESEWWQLTSLDEDLHTTAKAQHQVEGGLLLDVVIGQGAAVFELLSSEDKTLLVWWDAFLVLDLGLHIVDGVGRLHLQGDGLAGDWGLLSACTKGRRWKRVLTGLDEDLHGGSCCVVCAVCV